ncbi:RadC family protein [Methanogenium organophilum]|uniref:DNA repair protein RadC n=1 Tax=Methanogenium organophilum TaxID=2199 RepID=A0A9X9T9G3_METOG|nr:DNA repair protein RadC [Methanogenium organophilum]WAI02381.1 DNA repair protein RadC [Methanogenium organophilum]
MAVKRMRDTDKIDRPRERIAAAGPEVLKNHELVAAIIGKGIPGHDVNAIATDITALLDEKGTGVTYNDLVEIQGIGDSRASQMVASFELARRYLTRSKTTISRPEDILMMTTDLLHKHQEYFVAFTLNGAGEIIHRHTITKGTLTHSPVHPREVFAPALIDRAASVIFVHNHPSGNTEPSDADIAITRTLAEAGDILGIRVLDHVIVAATGHTSLKERGLF